MAFCLGRRWCFPLMRSAGQCSSYLVPFKLRCVRTCGAIRRGRHLASVARTSRRRGVGCPYRCRYRSMSQGICCRPADGSRSMANCGDVCVRCGLFYRDRSLEHSPACQWQSKTPHFGERHLRRSGRSPVKVDRTFRAGRVGKCGRNGLSCSARATRRPTPRDVATRAIRHALCPSGRHNVAGDQIVWPVGESPRQFANGCGRNWNFTWIGFDTDRNSTSSTPSPSSACHTVSEPVDE